MNDEQNNPDQPNTPEQQPQADPTTNAPTQADPSVPETPIDPQAHTTTTQSPDGKETRTTVEHQASTSGDQSNLQAGGLSNDDPQSKVQASTNEGDAQHLASNDDTPTTSLE